MSRAVRGLLTAAVILPLLLLTACSGAPASDVDITLDTTWQHLFDNFTSSEQSCIRGDLGDELLATTLGHTVQSNAVADSTVAQILSCLAPELAGAIYVSALIAAMEEDMDVELSGGQVSCLHEWARATDVVELLASPGYSAPVSVMADFLVCVPDLSLASMIERIDLTMDDLTGEETACLRQWATDADWVSLLDGHVHYEDVITETADDWLGCIPDQFIAALIDVIEESGLPLASDDLTEEQVSCLREWAATADVGSMVGLSEPLDVAIAQLAPGWVPCVPDLLLDSILAQLELGMDQLSEEEASCLRDWVADTDWTTLVGIDEAAFVFGVGMSYCLPDLEQ